MRKAFPTKNPGDVTIPGIACIFEPDTPLLNNKRSIRDHDFRVNPNRLLLRRRLNPLRLLPYGPFHTACSRCPLEALATDTFVAASNGRTTITSWTNHPWRLYNNWWLDDHWRFDNNRWLNDPARDTACGTCPFEAFATDTLVALANGRPSITP